jgi:hypothetical protein
MQEGQRKSEAATGPEGPRIGEEEIDTAKRNTARK